MLYNLLPENIISKLCISMHWWLSLFFCSNGDAVTTSTPKLCFLYLKGSACSSKCLLHVPKKRRRHDLNKNMHNLTSKNYFSWQFANEILEIAKYWLGFCIAQLTNTSIICCLHVSSGVQSLFCAIFTQHRHVQFSTGSFILENASP